MKNQICAILLSTLCLLQSADVRASDDSLGDNEQTRVLESFINPNCTLPECEKDLSLVYVRSSRFKNNNTTKSGPDLHFVLSTYDGSPAFFVTSTKNDSTTEINWDDLEKNKPHSIRFLPAKAEDKPYGNTIGLMISRIFFWLDNAKATAEFDPAGNVTELDLQGKWRNISVRSRTKNNVHVQYDLIDEENNGTISVRFMITSATQRYADRPSLILTPKTVHTQLTIEGFKDIWPENATKRMGIEFTVVSRGKLTLVDPKTLWDDEYSPGMFVVSPRDRPRIKRFFPISKLISFSFLFFLSFLKQNLRYLFGEKNLDSSFLGFMPNAYINKERMISKTIDTKQTEMKEATDKRDETLTKNHAFYGFFGEENDLHMNQMNITFGSMGQEFFTKTNLTEFSFVVGLNVLPEPEMSLFLKLVVIIGSGLSLLVLLIFPGTIVFSFAGDAQ